MSDWETLPEEPKIVEVVDEEVTSENDEDADLEELNLPDIIPEFDENNMDPENMSWPPRPSMPFMADTYDKMKAFILDPDQMEYIFPPMEGETRKLTHTVAELFGLKTKSYGRKNNRHVRVYKYEEIPQTIHNYTKDTIAAGNFNARAKEVKIPMYYKESPVALREEILAETHLGEKLVKRVIREGSGETPDYGHQVYVHYEGYYEDGGVFDSTRHREQEFMFILGEGHVISGWDIAVTSMKPGELIELLTPPEFGFGELGCPPRIPRNATLKYEIELFRFSLPLSQAAKSNAIPLSLAQSIECSNSSRCEGNALVSSNSLRKATKCYNRGLDYFTRLKDLTESDEAKVNECKLPLYSNLALCYIKLKDYKKAQRNCEMALAIDKNHMKALCRMGEALLAEKEVDKAYDYLMRAFEQNKKEPKVKQLLKQIQQIRTEEREMQQNMFKGVFS